MRRSFAALAVTIVASAFCPCRAANPTIAVMELGANNVAPGDVAGLTNRLRANLFATGAYTVVERSEMDEVLKEQGFQQSGCADASCAVQAGQLMGVQKMVVGSVDKVGQTYSVAVRMVDVATGRLDRNATVDCDKCSIEDVLKATMSDAAKALTGADVAVTPPRAAIVGLVPWDGRWRGVYTYNGTTFLVGTVSSDICLNLKVDSTRVTGMVSLNCGGRRASEEVPLQGAVSGTTITFTTTLHYVGTYDFEFRGTCADGQISGTFVVRQKRAMPQTGTWNAARDTQERPAAEDTTTQKTATKKTEHRSLRRPPGK